MDRRRELLQSSSAEIPRRCTSILCPPRSFWASNDEEIRCLHKSWPIFFSFSFRPAYCEERRDPNESYQELRKRLCDDILGDSPQYSLFRRDAAPVGCPFSGSFTFTYSRGHGECRSPVSRLDSCTENSRAFFRYQACPDVQGTESSGKFRLLSSFL